MKIFKLKSVLMLLFLATAFVSCDSNDDNYILISPKPMTRVAYATNINGPSTGTINEEISYDVIFTADNTCGEFDKFIDVIIGRERGLAVQAKYATPACNKVMPTPSTAVYKFKSKEKGTFDIKFQKSETEFIIKTVIIE